MKHHYPKLIALFIGLTCMTVQNVNAQSYTINTVAGNGTAGYTGDGGPATQAELYQPYGVAVDNQGNIYISDWGKNVIRKVDGSTGIITTYAGNDTMGYSGDGGPATSAELYFPEGIAVDANGNLYIADEGNARVRKVDASTGIITTVAGIGSFTSTSIGDGGPATAAEVQPADVAFDGQGNLYIDDFGNNLIRKVDATSGIITTIAGNGSFGYTGDGGPATAAEIDNPNGITVDDSGNVYIAGYNSNAIRKVSAATGIITTIAGDGTSGYTGDGGPATSARVDMPYDIALDTQGNIYFTGNDMGVVRKITAATGIINTIAGGGINVPNDGGPATSARLGYPEYITTDASGNIFFVDYSYFRVQELTLSTGVNNIADHSHPISLYPNPAISVLNIKCTTSLKNSPATIKIYNTLGQEVLTKQVGSVSKPTIPVDVHTLTPGIYFVKLVANKQTQCIKFSKL